MELWSVTDVDSNEINIVLERIVESRFVFKIGYGQAHYQKIIIDQKNLKDLFNAAGNELNAFD